MPSQAHSELEPVVTIHMMMELSYLFWSCVKAKVFFLWEMGESSSHRFHTCWKFREEKKRTDVRPFFPSTFYHWDVGTLAFNIDLTLGTERWKCVFKAGVVLDAGSTSRTQYMLERNRSDEGNHHQRQVSMEKMDPLSTWFKNLMEKS